VRKRDHGDCEDRSDHQEWFDPQELQKALLVFGRSTVGLRATWVDVQPGEPPVIVLLATSWQRRHNRAPP
jgi:hypothetical protein